MKKVIITLYLILMCLGSFSQTLTPPVTPGVTGRSTLPVEDKYLFARQHFGLPRFSDTSQANFYNGTADSCGALIYTYDVAAIWFRSCNGYSSRVWIQLLPAGTPGGLNAWLVGRNLNIPTDISGNGLFGTQSNYGVALGTNNTTRVILDKAGLTFNQSVSDTTLNKVMTYNTSTKLWGYSYWYGAGGGSSGWSLTGNSGTTAGTNFVGTTDAIDLVLKRSGTELLRLSSSSVDISTHFLPTTNSVFDLGGTSNQFRSLYIPTTTSSTTGVIYKGGNRFAHNFSATGTNGDNTFFGVLSGNFTLTGSAAGVDGSYNVGFGASTLRSLTIGYRNSAFGTYALQNNTTGFSNVATGHTALFSNTTGYNNSAFGTRALLFNTTGYSNSASGVDALAFNSDGYWNAGFGLDALYLNTHGYQNTAVGCSTLVFNTTGHDNVALGYRAGHDHLTGSYNTYIGDSTGQGITSGDNNTILGARVSGLSSSLANNIILADGAGTIRAQSASTGAWKFGAYGSGTFTGTPTKYLQVDASGNIIEGSTSLTVPISSLTAATGTNSIDNTSYTQTWNWSTLNSIGLSLTTNSTDATAANQTLLLAQVSGVNTNAGVTTYAAKLLNLHSGTTSNNVGALITVQNGATSNTGLDITASGGTTNHAIIIRAGDFAINGSTSGTAILTVGAAAGTPTLTLPTVTGTLFGSGTSSFTSAALLGALTDPTGTGVAVFGTSPAITTSITTPSTTFALLNTTATTVNAFGATTTLNMGASATMILNFGGSTTASEFRFLEPSGSGTNYSAFKAVAQGSNITYSLPPSVGAAGTFLTDVAGDGVLTWGTPAGTGANTALSNLASVSINTSLLAQTGVDLGSTTKPFRDAYLFGAGTYATTYLKLTGTPTSTRTVTFLDATYTVARQDAAQTFTGVQSFTSPDITTSITTPSTTFALVNTTATTINAFGAATTVNTGASATQIWNFGGSTTASEFRFLEPSGSGTNYSAFKAVAQGANITYSLPPTVGASGTVLTDVAGNGVLTWEAGGAGSSTWNGISNPTGTQSLSFDDAELTAHTNGSNTETFWTTTSNSLTSGIVYSFLTNSMTSGTLLDLTSTSTALAANNELLNLSLSGANGTNAITATGLRISVTNTNATSGTNIAASLTASGATTNNYALQATGSIVPGTDGGSSFGTTALGWQNLFANTGFVLNIENSDWVATHTAGILTIGTGTLKITNPTNTATSVTTVDGTQTQTNKRITARTGTTASSATPTINTDNVDFYSITALAANITSFTTNLSGTPVTSDKLWISITDNGTPRTIAWGASFSGSLLPATTVASVNLNVLLFWNGSTWYCTSVQ